MQGKAIKTRGAVRQALKAGLFSSVGIAGMLAGASAAHAEPGICQTEGNVTLFFCEPSSVKARIEGGDTSLIVNGAQDEWSITGDGVSYYTWDNTVSGDITSTLLITNSTISTTDNGGVNVSSNIQGRNDISVTLGPDVTVDSVGGNGGIWVRNQIAGDIVIENGAALTVSGVETNGISATTNAGSVNITNSGAITVQQTNGAADFTQRGIYADGGFNDAEPVEVTVTNTGQVEAQAAGIRVVNYNGLAKITNNAYVSSVNNQALVGWTPNGEVVIDNQEQGEAISANGPAIQGASQIGNITITNAGIAEGTTGILAVAGFDEDAPGSGKITITNSGIVTGRTGSAVQARTPLGDVVISNTGTLQSLSGIAAVDADTLSGMVQITNSGSILGETGIVTNSAATTIINAGTIEASPSFGHAILMGAGDVTLELHAGFNIIGLVADADIASGTNTLALGGAINASFDAGLVGTQYYDFDEFVKVGTGTWTLTGTGTTGWTVREGTLNAASSDAFGVGQAYVVEGGVLGVGGSTYQATLGSLTVGEAGLVSTDGGVLVLDQSSDTVFAGTLVGQGRFVKAGEGALAFTGNGALFNGALDVTGGAFDLTGGFSASTVTVGGAELASLNIKAVGQLNSVSAAIGMNGTAGSVTVDGGASWINSSLIEISRNPNSSGSLTITNGGSVETVNGSIYMGAGGSVSISGQGSALRVGTLHSELPADWVSADGWFSADEGSISVTDGGLLEADGSYIGGNGSGTATMIVDGADTVWRNGLSLYIGGTGNDTVGQGNVTVSGGAEVTSYTSALGVDTGSSGTLTLTGEGTTYSVLARNGYAGNMRVGYSGTGTATVSNGALLSAAALIDVASQEGSSGTLTIEAGGRVTGESLRIGGAQSAVGSVSVDGAGSTLEIGSGRIGIGISGEGTLMVSNGASASSQGAIIGWESTGQGTAIVSGAGSTWTNDGILYVGNVGEGTLNIAQGGRVTSTDGYVGTVSGSTGAANISGANSVWDMSGLFIAGNEAGAQSTISISNGGTLRAVQGTLGNLTGSQASMIVTGAGSTWSAYNDGLTNWAGYINVGLFGSGTLEVSDGGKVEAVRVYIGNDVASSGSVTVTGASSAIRTEEGLYIGAEGAGVLTLADGAELSAQVIKIGNRAGSTGTLNIGAAAGSAAQAAGMIDAVNGIQFGAGAGKLVLNHSGTDYALAAGLSGNGVVDVLAGTTVLTGDGSAYTGALNVNSGKLVLANVMNASSTAIAADGTLQIGNGGTAGTLAGDVHTNGTLVFNRSDVSSYGGSITGHGTIVNAGSGRLVLAGDSSTFAGQTKVDAGTLLLTGKLNGAVTVNANGTLQVGDGVRNGELTASTTNDGTLIFNQVADYDYTGALSGNGGLIKQGEGTLLLSGDYGYTGSTVVQAGRVRLLAQLDSATDLVVDDGEFDLSGTDQTVAGLSGAGGTVSLGTSTLTVNQSSNTLFGGSFSGSGTIALNGPSSAPVSINLTGESFGSFTGALNLEGIVTRVNGSMGGTITVGSDAALGGRGQVNNIVVGNGGTLLPGNSIGTLTAAGNVVFQAGSTYEVEVNAEGESDKLIVGGTATIQGGTVSVLAAAGNYRFSNEYTIITAAGGVTGQFAATDVDLPFLTPELSYDANNVRLVLTRNNRSFESVAVTPNQLAVALALDASDDNASLSRAVAGQLEEAGAVRAFDALSGELWATTGTLMVDGTRRLGDMVIGRMEQADVVSRTLAGAGSSARTLRDGSTAVWGQGIGAWSTLKSNGNAIKATQSTFGFITGVDTGLGGWRLGVAFAHEQNKVRVDGRSSEATVNGNSALVYAGGGWGALRARIGASYSWLDVNGTRKVAFLGVNDALAGDYDARSASAFGEVSYALPLGAVTAEPFAGVTHVHLKSDAFTETGSALTALGVTDSTRDVTYTTLGLRLGGAVPVSATTVLSPRVSAAWLRSFGDVDATSRNILSTGEAFSVAGLPTTRDTLRLEGGVQANIMPGGSIGATYVGNIGDQWKDHGVKIGFSYSF
ncbi:outer membrane autotransporter protein [Sphingobium sp. B2D3A]|uniref:autotransporter domain-containing protein n=1 Tax=unclassified Sphingobium TaxID=2611147 RepID=UPI002224274B|nr:MULTISPECIES: autotransporter domain-containing protein [unclassified Sphingobium]MCW2338622.1 outer membrane autotransporter protein [Sphingobium sp. B2D3A]MCW2385080.1 outer membrane autotransporter protein [Sphingobium sp. B2D3D]